ncbi:hypothetical protein D9M72_521550 [compost metagenome]
MARLAAVDVLAVGLQHQEHVDEVAGLDLVAHAHDLVGLDRHSALAFGNAQSETGNQLAFEQGRTFAQINHRNAAGERRGVLEGPCRIDRQLFHTQRVCGDRLAGQLCLGSDDHGKGLRL